MVEELDVNPAEKQNEADLGQRVDQLHIFDQPAVAGCKRMRTYDCCDVPAPLLRT